MPAGAIMRLGTDTFSHRPNGGSMKLSPDGKKLLTGSGSGNGLFVWDAVTGKLILRLPLGVEGEISRDGERLFVIEFCPLRPEAANKPPVGEPAGILDFYGESCRGKNSRAP